jgi:hypothetical protein
VAFSLSVYGSRSPMIGNPCQTRRQKTGGCSTRTFLTSWAAWRWTNRLAQTRFIKNLLSGDGYLDTIKFVILVICRFSGLMHALKFGNAARDGEATVAPCQHAKDHAVYLGRNCSGLICCNKIRRSELCQNNPSF